MREDVYICNVFSHWLRPCSATDRRWDLIKYKHHDDKVQFLVQLQFDVEQGSKSYGLSFYGTWAEKWSPYHTLMLWSNHVFSLPHFIACCEGNHLPWWYYDAGIRDWIETCMMMVFQVQLKFSLQCFFKLSGGAAHEVSHAIGLISRDHSTPSLWYRKVATLTALPPRKPSWWHRQMETFSALLALCAGNSPVTGEFPSQRPVMQSFDVFIDLCMNKHLSKQSIRWWSEMPSRSLWRHCNDKTANLTASKARVIHQANATVQVQQVMTNSWKQEYLLKKKLNVKWAESLLCQF